VQVDFIVGEKDTMKLAIHYELDKALAIAARNGDPTIVDKLLETGLHPDSGRDPDSGLSPFTAASQQWGSSGSSGHFQVLISLLQHGADPGQVDQNGRSLLMWAALRANAQLLRLILFEAGQAGLHHTKVLDAQDDRGRTALMEAVAAQDDGCVALLLAAGADADLLGQPGVVARDEEAAPPAAGAETAPAGAPALSHARATPGDARRAARTNPAPRSCATPESCAAPEPCCAQSMSSPAASSPMGASACAGAAA